MNDFEHTPASRSELELQLQRLQPACPGDANTSAELLYRCGWEAALAAQAAAPAAPAERRRPRAPWKAFGVGHLTGIAAGAAAVFCSMSFSTAPTSNTRSAATTIASREADPQSNQGSPNAIPQQALEVDAPTGKDGLLTVAPSTRHEGSFLGSQFDFFTARRSAAVAEPIVDSDNSLGSDQRALSPLAQHNWRSAFAQASRKSRDAQPAFEHDASHPRSRLPAHPYNIESLKELL